MAKSIIQKATFKASPKKLYNIYLNSEKHAKAVQSKRVTIQKRVGGRMTAFQGMIRGKFLALVKDKMIVQTWRSKSWKKKDPDSILVLKFNKVKTGTRIDLAHLHVPDYDHKPIVEGWKNYYWKRWKQYLNK